MAAVAELSAPCWGCPAVMCGTDQLMQAARCQAGDGRTFARAVTAPDVNVLLNEGPCVSSTKVMGPKRCRVISRGANLQAASEEGTLHTLFSAVVDGLSSGILCALLVKAELAHVWQVPMFAQCNSQVQDPTYASADIMCGAEGRANTLQSVITSLPRWHAGHAVLGVHPFDAYGLQKALLVISKGREVLTKEKQKHGWTKVES